MEKTIQRGIKVENFESKDIFKNTKNNTEKFLENNEEKNLSEIQNQYSPNNIEAERSLLGALLLNNNVFEFVSDFLKKEHFFEKAHGIIYEVISKILSNGGVADPITMKTYLEKKTEKENILEEVGGAEYLIDLTDSVISVMNSASYGKLIYDLYLRRELIKIGTETTEEARFIDAEINSTEMIERCEQKLYNLISLGSSGRGPVNFSEALNEAIENAELAFKRDNHLVGITTGFFDLDKWLGGLHNSDLLILAGRPSMGKTALATNIAFNSANANLKNSSSGAPVLFFSLEMSYEQLAMRILSSESEVSSDKIRRGSIHKEDFPKFIEVNKKIGELKLFIDDTPALSISGIRNRARKMKRLNNIGLIVIDYLQLIDGGSRKFSENRVNEISEITRSLKSIAKELNLPIIALSQLSRAVEQRDDKRPQLSDLRESGSIEQDADVVMFVFREEYYEARKEPKDGTAEHMDWQKRMSDVYNQAELIIAKQRHGPVGTIKLFFNSNLTKFNNLDKTY